MAESITDDKPITIKIVKKKTYISNIKQIIVVEIGINNLRKDFLFKLLAADVIYIKGA